MAGTETAHPYAWSVTSGILPSGLTLNASTGVISGTVGVSAVSETFTVTLTDADGVTATKSLTITVNVAPSITTTTLATATQTQTTYSQTLAGTAGSPPYTWSVTSGILPSGLTLRRFHQVISGTVGLVPSRLHGQVVDANGVGYKVLTLTVNTKRVDLALDPAGCDQDRHTLDIEHERGRHPSELGRRRDRCQPD